MINHPNIGSRIYDVLSRQIEAGKLKPGTRLKEEQLTKELGVSRTPLRDAMTRLVKDGYLEVEPRRGARVRKFSVRDVLEIYDIRKVLEGLAVNLAVHNIARRELAALKARFHGNDVKDLQKADHQLHDLIIRNCGNKRLIEILENLAKLICVFRGQGYRSPQRSKNASAQHLQIIAALLARDSAAAAKKIREHIENTKQEIIAELENRE